MLKAIDAFVRLHYFARNISVYSQLKCENKTPKRKVKETVELVNLVDTDDKILGLKPKGEAMKLARKLNLVLERVADPKYGKMYPAYKMFRSADLLKEEKKTSKTLKRLPLNSRISDHDLEVKYKTIRKWLMKNCEVHIAILNSGGAEASRKSLFNKIEDHFKNECRVLNIRDKEDALKFILSPPKQTKQDSAHDDPDS